MIVRNTMIWNGDELAIAGDGALDTALIENVTIDGMAAGDLRGGWPLHYPQHHRGRQSQGGFPSRDGGYVGHQQHLE